MEFNGTKGDWFIQFMNHNNKDDGESDFWVKSNENQTTHYGTDIMADDFGEHVGYSRDQRLSDAKLIAASPKLLKAAIDVLAKEEKHGLPPCFTTVMVELEKAVELATKFK